MLQAHDRPCQEIIKHSLPRFTVGSGFSGVGYPSGKWHEHTLLFASGCQFVPVDLVRFICKYNQIYARYVIQ